MMGLGEADVPDRLAPLPVWASQVLFAGACAAFVMVERVAVDRIAPGTGPYSIMYPVVMVATVFGRWQCGALTLAILVAFVWFLVLPHTSTFALARAGDGARTVMNVVTGAFVVATLNNGLVMVGAQATVSDIYLGLAIIAAMILGVQVDRLRTRRRK